MHSERTITIMTRHAEAYKYEDVGYETWQQGRQNERIEESLH
jgi:hypothetical protein